MQAAHELGLKSSATMMFGHVETIEDRIEHLRGFAISRIAAADLPRSSAGRFNHSIPS